MSILIEGLPNDIAITCLARVPYYLFPKLETVSHSWRATVHSTEFYKARQAVNSTESLLCVCVFDHIKQKNIRQLYDPNRDIWFTLPLLPSAVRNLADFRVASVSGKLFVLGGRNGNRMPDTPSKNEVWSYDPIIRQWAQQAPMIVPRAWFACCVWNGKILVAGGYTTSRKSTSKAEIYDPDTDTWDRIPDLDHGCKSLCTGFVLNGVVHVVNMVSKEVQVLESLNDKWRRSHSLDQVHMTVVNGSLYGKKYYDGDICKLERGIWEVVVPASEFNSRWSLYDMIGFRDDIYIIGRISDVNVLLLGNENEKPVLKKVASMTQCEGYIVGYAELRI